MNNVASIINKIDRADEVEIIEFDFDPCFRLLREMESAMIEFVERVEDGSVRSVYTYNKFNSILGRLPKK